MEDLLAQAYERFVIKKEGTAKQRKRVKKSYDSESQLLEAGENDDIVESRYESDEDLDVEEANPLVVPLSDGIEPIQEDIINMWFGQDVFAEAVEEGDIEKDDHDSENEMEINVPKEKKPVVEKIKENKKATVMDRPQSRVSNLDDIEIVPAPVTDSSDDSSSDESVEDIETKAEILVYGKKMVRKKRKGANARRCI
ncbi:hypothetical protein OROHE_022225 [Orobanche hederae]